MFMKWNTLNRNIIYNKQRVMSFIILGLKTTSWVGTIWSGLKANFHLLAQSFILAKSVLIWELHCVTLLTVENKDVSPLKSFEFEFKFSVRSLMYNRTKSCIKRAKISRVIDQIWFMHELPVQKPNWLGDNILLLLTHLYIAL